MKILIPLALLAAAAVLVSQQRPTVLVGPQADGSVLLNSGWSLRPAGEQMPLSTLPMSTALSPDGRFLVVLCGGYRTPSLIVLDAKTLAEIDRVNVADAWPGLACSPNGKTVYAGGGSQGAVFEFAMSNEGRLAETRRIDLVRPSERKIEDFVGDVAVSADGRLIYAAIVHRDVIAVINPLSGMVIERIKTGRRPYKMLFHPDGKSFFVSSWADGAIVHHKAETGERIAVFRVGPHPTDMIWRDKLTRNEEGEQPSWKARLFVASANTNNVYVLGVDEDKSARLIETLSLALYPRQPAGMTPSALALSPDQSKLYTVCSDANAVAVTDVSGPQSRMLGFIPVGWYPTGARILADGRAFILNGRGSRSFPNVNGPQPGKAPAVSHEGIRNPGYVGNLQVGTASVIAADYDLTKGTDIVRRNSPYSDEMLQRAAASNLIVPAGSGRKSPIEHVIYVVKENRTYDQVLGDLGKGNGDASLTLFNSDSAPNHKKLAREFTLLDNFYVNADVSADGHNWSTAAIAPDYVQKMWPNSYAGRRKHYDYEGGEPAALPPGGRIWHAALQKGLMVRNYGWWTENLPGAAKATGEVQIGKVRDPALAPHTNMKFRSFDLDYLDVERAKVFLADLRQFEETGKMPNLIFFRIGNDHTSGTSKGKYSPLAAMADNDLALGMLVEAMSKSKFWAKTAIFVLEDDAQNGPDHVDSHRSPAYVISPYSRTGRIDSTLYNTTSMLRTMELILGLSPMTHFDAAATPMAAAFSETANMAPYAALTPKQRLDERNGADAPMAARSAQMDFDEADEIEDDVLNEILWRAIKKTTPPVPVRSIFGK
ncbi:MAG: bifunctional YncE family protein/alkaline phosphatase family protein [Acidobacteria bacterium]|nr:bifunctional YncE family protein/alkaline phosphatase family protein [Acidobacteriota bacterium]